MNNLQEIMQEASQKLGGAIEFKGLMLKKARIRNGVGSGPQDILGWDYILRAEDNHCYEFYAAQPPLIGMTQPVPIPCPLGLRAFDEYEINFVGAIEKMDKMDCGDQFIGMQLFYPLTPEVTQPIWAIRTTIGNETIIQADSGDGKCEHP